MRTEARTGTSLTSHARVRLPIICGAMYPCSNPELVAAASEAGGIGILQPLTLTFVHRLDFKEGVRRIRSLTRQPIGMNALIEQSSRTYRHRMEAWIVIALEEGVRFFVTSLGKPDWVAQIVHEQGGFVYHDVTERKWAQKGVDCGVDGLIAVNRRAGGHPGPRSAEALLEEVGDLGVPVVCAGGIGGPRSFAEAMSLGYAGVQMGTRFIATHECDASEAYKRAIVEADEDRVVHTERITGVPVAVLNTPHVQRTGLRAGRIARLMLRGRRTKHWMRTIYGIRSVWKLRGSAKSSGSPRDYWQAGKSVSEIDEVFSVRRVMDSLAATLVTDKLEE